VRAEFAFGEEKRNSRIVYDERSQETDFLPKAPQAKGTPEKP